MTAIILKDNVEQRKIDALLDFLKSWDIDAELKITNTEIPTEAVEFSLSKGIWGDYDISSEELREKAWRR